MTLSVLKLKALLEQRGISYDNVVEKSELTELVEASGKNTCTIPGVHNVETTLFQLYVPAGI